MSVQATPQQPYMLVQRFPGFEVRHYPPALMAKVYSDKKTYGEMATHSFRTLAGYIFGNNKSGKKITMTAPVHIEFNDQGSHMAFVMPSDLEAEELPEPTSNAVHLEKARGMYKATITFGGYANDTIIESEKEKLKKLLKENDIIYKGNFSFLGYNAPYKFWNRRNEVAVEIIWE
jgi:hypothetical protein